MTDNNNAFAAVAANMGETIKAFRSSAVTMENKATPMARSILAAMVTGVATVETVNAAVIASFGNPKSPKTGKAIDKLSGLRDFVGGDATRKTVETVLKIAANINSAPGIRPLVSNFILDAKDAPKSLRALDVEVKALIAAQAAADAPAVDEPAETIDGKGETNGASERDVIADAILAIDAMDGATVLANDAKLAALIQSVTAAYARSNPAPVKVAA